MYIVSDTSTPIISQIILQKRGDIISDYYTCMYIVISLLISYALFTILYTVWILNLIVHTWSWAYTGKRFSLIMAMYNVMSI